MDNANKTKQTNVAQRIYDIFLQLCIHVRNVTVIHRVFCCFS